MRRLIVYLLAVLIPAAFFQEACFSQGHSAKKHVPGVLLVQLNSAKTRENLREVIHSHGLTFEELIPELNLFKVRIPQGRTGHGKNDERSVAAALKSDQRRVVKLAELDTIHDPAAVPNDPQYASQWHWPKISAPGAWDISTGTNTIKIAILDTGVSASHPDLSSKIVPGWNVYNNSSDTSDVHGHGTWVAGVAAAATNNSQGVAGMAWGPKIMPIRIADFQGRSYASTIAQGLVWAANNGARIANISFSELANDPIIDAAAYYFQMQNGLVVAAAGVNWAVSAADDPYILSVNATDQNDVLAEFCFPGTYADLAAPGVDILTTDVGGGYGTASGLSLSSPIVAGVAALVMSINPGLSPLRVAQTIKQTALDLGPAGYDVDYGAGRVNAQAAVSLAASGGAPPPSDAILPTIVINSPGAGQTVSGSVLMQITASDNIGIASVNLSVDGILKWVDTVAPFDTLLWASETVTNGSHVLRVEVVDRSLNKASAQVTVNVNNTTDTIGPQINISCPRKDGSVFSGVRDVIVGALDDTAVSTVSLSVDGGAPFASTTNSPMANFSWNTIPLSNATHTLTASATDIWGNTSSRNIQVVVRNIGGDTTAPLPPWLLWPLNEETTDNTPDFIWRLVSDPSGVSYRLLVSATNDYYFDSPIIDVGVTETSFTPGTPLPTGQYVWRVDAIDGAGNIESCGDIGVVTILDQDLLPPDAPTLSGPANGASIPNNITWFWTRESDPSGVIYELQVDNSGAAFPSPEINLTNLSDNSYTRYLALPLGTYSWRVRARDEATPPNFSAWSAVWSHTVLASADTTAPATPSLMAPANGSSSADVTPSFDWGDVTDASGVGYQIQVDDSGAAFPSPEVDFSGYISSAFTTTTLLPLGTYSWRVRTFDGVGLVSAWSSLRTFTVIADTVPPTVPVLLSPSNNAISHNQVPLFDWANSSDVNNITYEILVTDSFYYQFYYYYKWDLTVSQFLGDRPITFGTFAWRVRAFDGVNYSDWSPSWALTIAQSDNPNPTGDGTAPTVSITSPSAGATVSDVTTILAAANDNVGIDHVEIMVDDVPLAYLSQTPYQVDWFTPYVSNGTHTIQAQAIDTSGNSSSTQLSVTVNNLTEADPPYLALACPQPWTGATLPGTHVIRVASGDYSNLSSLVITVDGTTMLPRGPEWPYTFSWNTTSFADGAHTLRADAVDRFGNATFREMTLTVKNSGADVTPPSSPPLLAPINWVTVANSRPTFDWGDVTDPGGVTYRLVVDDDGDFSSPVINVSGLAVSTYTPPANLPDRPYNWRVDVKDGAGNLAPCGDIQYFAIENFSGPPPVPTLIAPTNGATLASVIPTLDWTDVTDLTGIQIGYMLQVDDNSDFSSPITDTFTSPSFWPQWLPSGTYYWRVRSSNGELSAWSSVFSFTLSPGADTTAPAAPVLVSPANGVQLDLPTPLPGAWRELNLDWNDVSDPSGVSYELQVDNSGITFPSPEIVDLRFTSSWAYYNPADGPYAWRVRAQDGIGNVGPWSSAWTFTLDETAPVAPALLTPANAAVVANGTPVFDWADAVDTSGIRFYRLEISDANFVTEVFKTNLAASTYTPATALPPGLHYWRVGAEDMRGNFGAMGPRFSFRVQGDGTAPAAPTLVSPSNGNYTSNTRPTFDWDPVADPSGVTYRIQVDNSGAGFPSPEINISNLTSSLYTPPAALAAGTYYWHVMATDGVPNAGVWSAVWTVNIGLTPPVPLTIASSSPPHGYVDPFEDNNLPLGEINGPQDVSITFSRAVTSLGGGPLTASNFILHSYRNGISALDLETESLPTVRLVSGSGAGPYALKVEPRLPLAAWTKLEAVDVIDTGGVGISGNANSITIGFLPMDITQDGRVLGNDISQWLAIFNNNPGAPPNELDYCNQDREGGITGADINRSLQLINGSLTYQSWSGVVIGDLADVP